MNRLLNKIAIITGASSGIGYETAKLFAKEGAKIIVGARRKDNLNQLVNEILAEGGQAVALAGDVTSEDYNKAVVDLALSEFGKLDIAFNNAGILGNSDAVTDLSLDDWNQIICTNLTSGFLAAKYQIPMMDKGSSIIFTSSFVGCTLGMPKKAAYAASKAGITGLTKALAVEYGSKGIRVNALLPGGTITPMADEFGNNLEVIQYVENMHALKRRAKPIEIAEAAIYLASEASSFVTGTSMLVDGGVSICKA